MIFLNNSKNDAAKRDACLNFANNNKAYKMTLETMACWQSSQYPIITKNTKNTNYCNYNSNRNGDGDKNKTDDKTTKEIDLGTQFSGVHIDDNVVTNNDDASKASKFKTSKTKQGYCLLEHIIFWTQKKILNRPVFNRSRLLISLLVIQWMI